MNHRPLSEDERSALWQRAWARLQLVDVEPPVTRAEVDALLEVVGRRAPDQSIADWLKPGQAASETGTPATTAEIIQFNPRRQRFTPVAEFVRLAADNGGMEVPLPSRALETADGRFRLQVAKDGDELKIEVQALGQASDLFAGCLMGLAGAGGEEAPVALFRLDEDGDGSVRIPDGDQLRRALLRPVLGRIDES